MKLLAQSPKDRRAHNGKRDRARDMTREQKRAMVKEIMSMDTLYSRKDEPFSPQAIALQMGITFHSAAHLCSSMASDGKLDVVKRRDHRGCMVNWYCRVPPKASAISWRKNPNFKPMPPYWRLGAPI